MSRKNDGHVNWMDQAFGDYEKEGLKSNPGFGKPLPDSFFSGSVYDNFLNTAKNAGYLPPWIKLQKEIRKEISTVIKSLEDGKEIVATLDLINDKISKYNLQCPPNMQRRKVEIENIKKQYEHWE